jgi:hypothetical protein
MVALVREESVEESAAKMARLPAALEPGVLLRAGRR